MMDQDRPTPIILRNGGVVKEPLHCLTQSSSGPTLTVFGVTKSANNHSYFLWSYDHCSATRGCTQKYLQAGTPELCRSPRASRGVQLLPCRFLIQKYRRTSFHSSILIYPLSFLNIYAPFLIVPACRLYICLFCASSRSAIKYERARHDAEKYHLSLV